MRVAIISYYDYDQYLRQDKKLKIYENWHNVWEEVFNLSKKNNIKLTKYNARDHKNYDKLIFLEIPRINDLIKVLYLNLLKKRVPSILIINETFLGRARYMLRVPFLFNKVLINSEENIKKFMAYKVSSFSYPSVPNIDKILNKKSQILNVRRKKKLVFISSFKMALNNNGSYIYRYKLVKELLKNPNYFDLYGYGWDKTPLPFDVIGIAIILRISFLKNLVQYLMRLRFKPLGKFPISEFKSKTLEKYDFALAIEPTVSKFNSICEKIFDPMLSGSIPIYFGQEKINVPKNTYIRINKNTSVIEIINIIKNLSEERKSEYRENIFNFLNSKKADRYRYHNYAKFFVNTLLY